MPADDKALFGKDFESYALNFVLKLRDHIFSVSDCQVQLIDQRLSATLLLEQTLFPQFGSLSHPAHLSSKLLYQAIFVFVNTRE